VCTRYPFTAGWTEAVWDQPAQGCFMNDQCHRESNPGPLALRPNALTTIGHPHPHEYMRDEAKQITFQMHKVYKTARPGKQRMKLISELWPWQRPRRLWLPMSIHTTESYMEGRRKSPNPIPELVKPHKPIAPSTLPGGWKQSYRWQESTQNCSRDTRSEQRQPQRQKPPDCQINRW